MLATMTTETQSSAAPRATPLQAMRVAASAGPAIVSPTRITLEKINAFYDQKQALFDVNLENGESWRESRVYHPGSAAVVVDTPLARFGLSICYDVRFPYLYRAMARAGAEVFCVPAAFTRQTGRAHWKTLLAARAIECGAFVIAAAQGGAHEDGRETFGHSLIVSPWGDILAEAKGDEPGVILAEIDPLRVKRARAQIPSLALETRVRVHNLEA